MLILWAIKQTHTVNQAKKNFSESKLGSKRYLGGVEPEAKTASVVEMRVESKNPSDDLPNKEKEPILNWLLTRNRGFLYTKGRKRVDQENNWPLRRG